MPEQPPIRPGLNWLILFAAMSVCISLLAIASHASSMILCVAAAIAFSFVNNSVFSLLHEAVHRIFDPSPKRNELAGGIAALFFPTSLTMQRAFHMTHHSNNRSLVERFDHVAPDENVVLKTAQWYTIITGLYWISAPIFAVFYALFAGLIPWRKFVVPGSKFANQTSADAYFSSIFDLPLWRVRLEVVTFVLFHVALFWLFDLSLFGWALCYGAFALNWSSQQYANHAFTVFDRDEGAWNITVGKATGAVFLNYHHHLAHHQDTARPWHSLARFVPSDRKRVAFADILYLMWKGPKLAPNSGQNEARQRLLNGCIVAAHTVIFGVIFLAIYGSSSADYLRETQLFGVATAFDASIPFIPAAGIAYISLNALMLLVPFILKRPERTLPFLATLVIQLIIAWIFFHLYPVELPPVPPVPRDTIVGLIFAAADAGNLDGNGLPSLHVAFALSCAWVCAPFVRRWAAILLWLWAAAISVATLLTYQHYLIDALAGAIVAVLTMAIIHPRLTTALAAIEQDIMGRATHAAPLAGSAA
jgi:membrane-associated phospholipid phosphatase/fatty acid desaturase